MQTRSDPEVLGWKMDLKRKAAYLALCAAMEDKQPACAANGPTWDQMTMPEQKGLCLNCPLKVLCGKYAETDPENTYGVWGGKVYPRTASGRISKKTGGELPS